MGRWANITDGTSAGVQSKTTKPTTQTTKPTIQTTKQNESEMGKEDEKDAARENKSKMVEEAEKDDSIKQSRVWLHPECQ